MGCASSKIETEEAVKRSKARKQFIKQAVAHRHAFAASHASYCKSLKSTGAAIRQLADVEATPEGPSQPASASLAVRPTILPPPQPPEDPSLGPRTPLPRAASMPPIPLKSQSGSPSKRSLGSHPQDLSEANEEELYEHGVFPLHKPTHSETIYDPFDNIPGPGTSTFDTEDFELQDSGAEDDEIEDEHYHAQTPVRQVKRSIEDKASFGKETIRQPQVPLVQQKMARTDQNFGTILYNLDDLFLKIYAAAGEVSRMLEAKRDYQHIPFVDEKSGIEEHNKKVSRILTWTQSSSGSLLANDEIDISNLASTLDRLHAWEKKLYDEVKAAEATRLELERRSSQLKNRREGQEASAAIEKTKALVKSLNTRYLVEIEAMGAAVSEVQKLRDKSLYPQLVDLLKALKVMWREMLTHHEKQVPLVEELSKLVTPSTKETSEFCKKITEDLEREVVMWHNSLEDMVTFQKKCVTSLLDWLHLNDIQIESEADENPASQKDLPLYKLCQAWDDVVKQLSAEKVLQNLKQFSSSLQDVATKQADEIKQKRRKEDLYKDLEKKKKAFDAFERKYKEKASSKGSQEYSRHPIQERKALIELLQKNVAEEEQRYAKLCEENSTMIFQSLKDGLPDVVYSIMAFSRTCTEKYGKLVIPSEASPS